MRGDGTAPTSPIPDSGKHGVCGSNALWSGGGVVVTELQLQLCLHLVLRSSCKNEGCNCTCNLEPQGVTSYPQNICVRIIAGGAGNWLVFQTRYSHQYYKFMLISEQARAQLVLHKAMGQWPWWEQHAFLFWDGADTQQKPSCSKEGPEQGDGVIPSLWGKQ